MWETGVAQDPPRRTSWLHMNLPLYSPSAPSGGENPGTASSEGVGVDCNRAFIGESHASIIWDEGQTGSLPNRENYGITFLNMVAVGNFVDG